MSTHRTCSNRAYETFADIVLAEGGIEHFRRNDPARIARSYGSETIGRLERAKAMTLGRYALALQAKRAFSMRLHEVMATVDFLVLPTCPCTAPRLNEESIDIGGWSGTVREALMTYTAPFNLAGLPAISIPLQTQTGHLPAALQIVAKSGSDGALLQLALQVEQLLRPDDKPENRLPPPLQPGVKE